VKDYQIRIAVTDPLNITTLLCGYIRENGHSTIFDTSYSCKIKLNTSSPKTALVKFKPNGTEISKLTEINSVGKFSVGYKTIGSNTDILVG